MEFTKDGCEPGIDLKLNGFKVEEHTKKHHKIKYSKTNIDTIWMFKKCVIS